MKDMESDDIKGQEKLLTRRDFNGTLAGIATVTLLGSATVRAATSRSKLVLYTSVGDRMTHYDLDVDAATLTPRATLTLPSTVQYAWPHPTGRYLYASTSDATPGSRTATGSAHRLCALRVGADGALTLHGQPAALPQRPIHNSLDRSGKYALTAYTTPAAITVNRINADGTVGPEIVQKVKVDTGIFPHQVRATPANRSVVLVTRGNSGNATRAEDPGALKLYRFTAGQLSPLDNIPVGGKGGYGYGPRHLDFHPTKPWVYISVERQNQLHMHKIVGDSFAHEPSFIVKTTEPQPPGGHQVAGAIHVHPKGHVVYVSNRASGTTDFAGKKVFKGGDNSIVVYAIDPQTGEPRLIQRADPHGFHVRAFAVDPSGKLLVAATMLDMWTRDGDTVTHVPAGLSLFRIGEDGQLTFVRKYDVDTTEKDQQLWVGILALPA